MSFDPTLFYHQAGRVERNCRQVLDLPTSFTPKQLISMFALGKVKLYDFRINEGWTYSDLEKALSSNPNVTFTLNLYSYQQNIRRLGIGYTFLEGVFFPDTYSFEKGAKDLEILSEHTIK